MQSGFTFLTMHYLFTYVFNDGVPNINKDIPTIIHNTLCEESITRKRLVQK